MATGTVGAGGNLATSNDVYVTFTQDTTETQSVALNDTSFDFLTMGSMDWTVEYSLVNAWSDDVYGLGIRIVNGATILAAADSGGTFASVASGITTTTDTTAGPTGFAYVNTGANKATWDGATIELQQTHGQEMGPDNNGLQVDYVTFDIVYTANEIVFGSASSTTETANALQGIDVVSNGVNAATSETANAGGVVYPGSTATTTDSATTGSADVVVNGATASTTDTAVDGQDGGDYIEPGAAAATTDVANGGAPLMTIIGANPSTTDVASAGQDGGDYIEVGATATTLDTAAVGTLSGNFTITGQTATTTETPKPSNPRVYEAEGTFLDEHGRHVLGGIDESGNKYFPKLDPETEGATLNEHGDWVDVTLAEELSIVFGAQAFTLDTPNNGTIGSENVVNGVKATTTDTANAGFGFSEAIVEGVAANTLDVALSEATLDLNITLFGTGANTTDTAVAGSALLEETPIVFGQTATETDQPNLGAPLIVVPGSNATTSDTAQQGLDIVDVLVPGGTSTTTETVTRGSIIIPGFITIGGKKAGTTETPVAGTFAATEIVVSGVRTRTYDNTTKGLALGGAAVYRVLLEKRVKDKVFSGV